jgi:polygalacturonase
MRSMPVRLLIATLLAFFATAAHAQDTRQVTEPHIPAACATLDAAIAAHHGVLSVADEQKLDTARIQSAMDGCKAGGAVVLRAHGKKNVFLTGPLELRSNVTLVIAKNTALVASRDPRLFDLSPGGCGIVAEHGHGCKPLITGDGVENSGIMGEGSIDGRGGDALLGQNETWWDLAHEAKVKDLSQNVFALIVLRDAKNFTMYEITLRNSPNFHVSVNQSDGFTAWGVKIMTPKTARNTDGIDPSSSRNVTIENCFIHTGDDDVAVKSSRAGAASNISVLHDHFYTGHGMSIGSGTDGGVDHLLVDDLTIDGADNGIRVKSDRSRGGLVHELIYKNVCIRNVPNPLVFTPLYTTFSGDRLPIYRDITLEDVHVLTAGAFTFYGLDADHKLEIKLDNVFADDQEHLLFYDKDADIAIGAKRGNLEPKGDDVNIAQASGATAGEPLACNARFVPFPATPTAPEMAGKIPPEDHTLYVAADGTGDYYSIQRALDIAPATGAVISVSPGVYREVLTVDKPNITIRSANPDASKTIVVNDRSAGLNGGTLHSATVNVKGDNFFAENITFQNDFNRTHPQLPQGSQALALLVTGDRAVFHNVRLLGNQDTVFTGSKGCTTNTPGCQLTRQYFSDCYIEGNVDFIFGDGKTVFDRCVIHSTPHDGGFITAQSKHYPEEDSGYVFNHCTLTADPDVKGYVYLGRPWRPYATVVYLHTEMDDKIAPAGWSEWHAEVSHTLDTAFYAEFDSTGLGARHNERDPHTHFLTPEEARQYDPQVFLRGADNWNPRATGAQ